MSADDMSPSDQERVIELTEILPGLDPDDRIAVQAEIDLLTEKYKYAEGGEVIEVIDEYAGGGYVPRGTMAGEIDRGANMSVREKGETMYELAKRHRDERAYMGGGGEVEMSRRARRMFSGGEVTEDEESKFGEYVDKFDDSIEAKKKRRLLMKESLKWDTEAGANDPDKPEEFSEGGEAKKKRKKKKSSVDGTGAGKCRGGGAATKGLIFRGVF